MKKLIPSVLILLMLLSFFTVSALAEGSGAVSASSASAQPGDTVTLTVTISSNPGIFNITIPIRYDPDVLENPQYSAIGSNWTIGSNAYWENEAMRDSTFTGDVLTLTFHVKDDAAPGETSVTLGPVDAWNLDEENIPFSASAGTVTILAPEASPSPAPSESPSPSTEPTEPPAPTESPAPSEEPTESPAPSEEPTGSPAPSEEPSQSPSPSTTPKPSATPKPGGQGGKDKVPKTGEETPVIILIVFVLSSLTALILFLKKKHAQT